MFSKDKLLFVLFFFLTLTSKTAISTNLEELLYQLPITNSILNALPTKERQKLFFLSSKTWLEAYKHRKAHESLEIDRAELIKYPEVAQWFKTLTVNWKGTRYLWQEPQATPPNLFIPKEVNISYLKKLTTFALNIKDLSHLIARVSGKTFVHVTLVEPITSNTVQKYIKKMSPVIRTSSFYANFDTTKTMYLFLKGLKAKIIAQESRGKRIQLDRVLYPYYIEKLSPKLYFFIHETDDKERRSNLTKAQERKFQLLKEEFSSYLEIKYLSDISPQIKSRHALIGMSNRVEILDEIFARDDTEDEQLESKLDAALNLSQFHPEELQQGIEILEPYFQHLDNIHARTVLLEGLMHLPPQHRQNALNICFQSHENYPPGILRNIKHFYCLHLFPARDHEEVFTRLEKLYHSIVLATCLVPQQITTSLTMRNQAKLMMAEFMGSEEEPLNFYERLDRLKTITS